VIVDHSRAFVLELSDKIVESNSGAYFRKLYWVIENFAA